MACERGTTRQYSFNGDNNLVSNKYVPTSGLPRDCQCFSDVPHIHIWNTTYNSYVYVGISSLSNSTTVEITTGDSVTGTVTIKKIIQDKNYPVPPSCIYSLIRYSSDPTSTPPIISPTASISDDKNGINIGIPIGITIVILIIIGFLIFLFVNNRRKRNVTSMRDTSMSTTDVVIPNNPPNYYGRSP